MTFDTWFDEIVESVRSNSRSEAEALGWSECSFCLGAGWVYTGGPVGLFECPLCHNKNRAPRP